MTLPCNFSFLSNFAVCFLNSTETRIGIFYLFLKLETRYMTNQRTCIINVIFQNVNISNFSLVKICTRNKTKCSLANIANFSCVESDDCVKEVLDGNADVARASANSMAKNGKFRV